MVSIAMVAFSKLIPSQRGGQILVDTDGYLYTLKHKQKTKNTYLCRRHSRKKTTEILLKCPAKLLWFSESNLFLENPHNHDPTPGESEAYDVKAGIKRKAIEQSLSPTQNIITEALVP